MCCFGTNPEFDKYTYQAFEFCETEANIFNKGSGLKAHFYPPGI